MWLAGEVFPRAWKLLGYCRSWLGLLSRLSGSLACRVVIRHRLGEPVGLVVLCGCIMHGGCISPLETLSDARLKHMGI